MAVFSRFEDIEAWQLARQLCNMIHAWTLRPEFSKNFKLRDQIEGSSGSIMDNIAEGYERGGNKEFVNFLSIAKGSCGETRSQCYRVLDFKYINQIEFDEAYALCMKISTKITNLMNYLIDSDRKGFKFDNKNKDKTKNKGGDQHFPQNE
ncbi:MAG TPA: four helix bundle protein [Saprospiraceae bacterium]|nr:four helix bundle protein [Saprospiraceae bacterium]